MLMHCCRDRVSLKKIRDEFLAYVSQHPAGQDSTKTKKQAMYEIVDIEAVQDLDYLSRVLSEALRF